MTSTPFVVGNVISIDGLSVSAMMHDNTNLLNYYYNGEYYSGVGIGAYVGITRGPYKIIGKVEKEFLEDSYEDISNQDYALDRYKRIIELKIIGKFDTHNNFTKGVGTFPLIYDEIVLLSDNEIQVIIQGNRIQETYSYSIGKTVNEEVVFNLPWNNLLNTHIGIFGNTGSGKSNTLAKIYTELFNRNGNNIFYTDISKFVFIDFNGEYTGDSVLTSDKTVLKLDTSKNSGDKIKLSNEQFWDVETLSILFSATEKTQQPFLKNTIDFYIIEQEFNVDKDHIINSIGQAFYNVFNSNNNKETLTILRNILDLLSFDYRYNRRTNNSDLYIWMNSNWHDKHSTYYSKNPNYFMSDQSFEDIQNNREELVNKLNDDDNVDAIISQLTLTQKLLLFTQLRLIFNLANNYSQYDHINPLIERIEARKNIIDRLIEISDESLENDVTVISLSNCNQEAKKIIPLLITKQFYTEHKIKISNETSLNKTFHLVIDEAHNILSESSNREESTWKDYRLEVFEEIIKEGRKFGFYTTISSQRPSDISQTIISQIHNFFIHRLVNDQDLKMIGNTINSLDSLSRRNIPELGPGQCVVTGTSFEMPIIIKVDILPPKQMPDSENANLEKIWSISHQAQKFYELNEIECNEILDILNEDKFLYITTIGSRIPSFHETEYIIEIFEFLYNDRYEQSIKLSRDFGNEEIFVFEKGQNIDDLLIKYGEKPI